MRKLKVYGAVVPTLPIGFHVATTLEDQVDALYAAADAPGAPKHLSEQYARMAAKLLDSRPQL